MTRKHPTLSLPKAANTLPELASYEPNQIMLDLETLDTKPTAIVLSIGLARFDPADLQNPIKDTHYVVLSVGDQEENQRTVSESTLAWWQEQSDEAKVVLAESAKAEHAVHEQLLRVAEWMGKDAVIWGNGSDFDNVILADLYRTYEFSRQPWSHKHNRCYRTLQAMSMMLIVPDVRRVSLLVREGTHHNALDDAVHQARQAALWLQDMRSL